MIGYGSVGAYAGHHDLASPSVSGDRMGHAFPHTDDQIRKRDESVHFNKGAPVGPADDYVVGCAGIVRRDAALQPGVDLGSNLLLGLRRGGHRVCSNGTDCRHAFIADAGPVEPVHDLG